MKNIIVRSTIQGGINDYIKTIEDIQIRLYPETEIISIKSKAKDIHIDTLASVSSKSLSGLAKAERKLDINKHSIRDTITVTLEGRKNNTRLYLSSLVGVLAHIKENKIEKFDGMEAMSINHMDKTGNMMIYGYSNNRLYNLELCSLSQNTLHGICVDELERLYPGKRFAISALDDELINVLRFGADKEDATDEENDRFKKAYMDSIAYTGEFNNYGVLYIGKAGLKLRKWKEFWENQKLEMEIQKVRCQQIGKVRI